MQREAAREISQLLTKDQAPAMQPRLERLIFHAKHRARFLGRHPLKIAQHNRRPEDRRKRKHRTDEAAPELRPQQVFVGHV